MTGFKPDGKNGTGCSGSKFLTPLKFKCKRCDLWYRAGNTISPMGSVELIKAKEALGYGKSPKSDKPSPRRICEDGRGIGGVETRQKVDLGSWKRKNLRVKTGWIRADD